MVKLNGYIDRKLQISVPPLSYLKYTNFPKEVAERRHIFLLNQQQAFWPMLFFQNHQALQILQISKKLVKFKPRNISTKILNRAYSNFILPCFQAK